MKTRPDITLIMPTINALDAHKPALGVLGAAKSRGIGVVVAVDDRTTDGTVEAFSPLVDRFVPFPNTVPYCEEIMDELVAQCHTSWIFWLCDDETPSEQLWKRACTIHRTEQDVILRPTIISPLPGWSGGYVPLRTYQPRIFPNGSIRWPGGGLDILPLRSLPEQNIPEVLWHFNLWATRESREKKTAAHEAAWLEAWDHHPWPASSRKAYLFEDYPNEIESLGPWKRYLPK